MASSADLFSGTGDEKLGKTRNTLKHIGNTQQTFTAQHKHRPTGDLMPLGSYNRTQYKERLGGRCMGWYSPVSVV